MSSHDVWRVREGDFVTTTLPVLDEQPVSPPAEPEPDEEIIGPAPEPEKEPAPAEPPKEPEPEKGPEPEIIGAPR